MKAYTLMSAISNNSQRDRAHRKSGGTRRAKKLAKLPIVVKAKRWK